MRLAVSFQWRRLQVTSLEVWGIALLTTSVTAWALPTRGWRAFDLVPLALGLSYLWVLLGRSVVRRLELPIDRFGDLPTVLLLGWLVLNSLLFIAALVLPTPLPVTATLVIAGALLIVATAGGSPGTQQGSGSVGLVALVLSLLAASLWSIDSLNPIAAPRGGTVLFRPWADSDTHACFIRLFRDARGAGSLDHFAMAGEPAPIYHYASFLLPALVAATSPTSCYLAYTSFMVPLGMTLVGLAAFALIRWWFSPTAGLAAVVGVLVLPDAASYGIANRFLGYYWLAETGPTLTYGIAALVVAWLLVLEGTRARRLAIVVAGFAAAGLSIAFKAHLFVANAFLLWIYPPVFLQGIARRTRATWLIGALLIFVGAVRLSWNVPGVPLLKLDGSGLLGYLAELTQNLDNGPIKSWVAVGPDTPGATALFRGLVHLSLGTFGVFLLLIPLLIIGVVCSHPTDHWRWRFDATLFPVLIMANYLVMALGLAVDDRTNHMPEELLHRPLVWAYFVVAAWTLGALVWCLLPRDMQTAPRPALMVIGLLPLLGFPLWLGSGIQQGPGWGREVTNLPVPVGLIRSAEFLRDHSQPGEVIQNSEPDRWNILSALAERPVYVADAWRTPTRQADPTIRRRLAEIANFRLLTDATAIRAFARDHRITWFVLNPQTPTRWPRSVLDQPTFEFNGWRVFHFSTQG